MNSTIDQLLLHSHCRYFCIHILSTESLLSFFLELLHDGFSKAENLIRYILIANIINIIKLNAFSLTMSQRLTFENIHAEK